MPSLLTQTIKGAVLENRNIADDLKTNLMFGIGYKANALYNYGRGEYHWGLPEGTAVTYGPTLPAKVKMSIEREVNQKVFLISSRVDVNSAGEMYYTAYYYLLDALGEALTDIEYTWSYNESTGLYSYLDLNLQDVQAESQYYPIIPIRVDNVDYTDNSHEHHVDVKRACNYLGIKATDLAEEIANANEDGGNPTEDAHVVLAVNINDDTFAGKLYLYNFFQHQQGVSLTTEADFNKWKGEHIVTTSEGSYFEGDPPFNTVRISDSTFQLELSWLYITHEIKSGILTNGTIDTCTRGYSAEVTGYTSTDNSRYFSGNVFWIKKQINATQYSELKVYGLTFSNWAVGKEINTTLKEAFSEDDEVASAFCVPLRKDLTKALGPLKTHDLMYRSIRLVVSDKNRVKLKWYQTSIFRFAMVVVAVVVSLLNPPAGVAIFSATMAVNIIVQLIITQIILPAVLSAVVDVLGEELGIIVAMVAAFYTGGGSLTEITTSLNGVLQAGLSGISGLNNYVTNLKLESLSEGLAEVNEDISDLLDVQAETSKNTGFAVGISRSDNYAIMDPSTYVTKSMREPRLPTMIGYTVTNYTDIMRYLDTPTSNINLGNTLT